MELPDYYFRIRDNGAVVFRIDIQDRTARIEMDQIAVVNVKNGEIKPHGTQELTETDLAEIHRWLDDRRALLARRELDEIAQTVDRLNKTTAWAQQRATEDDLASISDALLLAMHDLRTVLVRKKADRVDDTAGTAKKSRP